MGPSNTTLKANTYIIAQFITVHTLAGTPTSCLNLGLLWGVTVVRYLHRQDSVSIHNSPCYCWQASQVPHTLLLRLFLLSLLERSYSALKGGAAGDEVVNPSLVVTGIVASMPPKLLQVFTIISRRGPRRHAKTAAKISGRLIHRDYACL